MIRVYRAKQIGSGTRDDPYRSVLHNFVDVTQGDHFEEIDFPLRKFSVCLLSARQSVHDAVVAYEAVNPGTVNYLSSLHPDMASLRNQYAQPWANLPLAFRTKAEALLGVDGLADFSGTIKQVFKRLLMRYRQNQRDAVGNTKPITTAFKFGAEDF